MSWLRGRVFAHRGLHGRVLVHRGLHGRVLVHCDADGRVSANPGAPDDGPASAQAGAASDLPENSLAAFSAAIARGLGIECDVQLSADGEAMVFHDATLDRLTEAHGPLATRTAAELASLHLAGTAGTMPRLADLLALVASAVPLLIEIKAPPGQSPARLGAAVARALAAYPGPHAIMSFDPRVPAWFARHASQTPRGLVASTREPPGTLSRLLAPLRLRLAAAYARADFLALDIQDLPSRFAARQRALGRPIASWTVRSPELLARARAHADAPIAEGPGVPADTNRVLPAPGGPSSPPRASGGSSRSPQASCGPSRASQVSGGPSRASRVSGGSSRLAPQPAPVEPTP